MTEAQAKRTRLKTWKDILVSVGGTPRNGDTLRITLRKTLLAMGGTPGFNHGLRQLGRAIFAVNPHVYSGNDKVNPKLLPQAGPLKWGTDPASADPALDPFMLGDPENDIALGDPDGDIAFGRP